MQLDSKLQSARDNLKRSLAIEQIGTEPEQCISQFFHLFSLKTEQHVYFHEVIPVGN